MNDTDRAAILDAEVARFVTDGYRVVSRTPFTAQLVRPKQFSAGMAFAAFLLCGIGIVLYLLAYWGERDATAYLTVDADGALGGEFYPPRPVQADRWTCGACGFRNHALRTTCKSCRTARP